MSVGDSAEEFISIHALGHKRLLVLSCDLLSHPLKILFFARLETIEFYLSFPHTSRQMCFQQRPDRRPHKSPAVEWALYTKGGSEPLTSSPRSEFMTMSLISSNEVCGEHEIARRLI